jgi:hypothetical protein
MVIVACSMLCAVAAAQSGPQKPAPVPLLRVAENHQGGMVAEETCAIVYIDGKYRSERYLRKRTAASVGFETDSLELRESQVSKDYLNRLLEIIDTAEFRQLKSPNLIRRIVDEDYHALHIAIFRQEQIQELKYPNKASRKADAAKLKPLLDWWQQLRKNPAHVVSNAQRTHCMP